MAGYEALGYLVREEITFEIGRTDEMRIDLSFRFDASWGGQCNGQVRDFSISLWAEADDVRYEIERVDTCHSEIHRHRFYRDRPEDRVSIVELNPGDEALVDTEFLARYSQFVQGWVEMVRRWKGGR
jgi:hypothetical protein